MTLLVGSPEFWWTILESSSVHIIPPCFSMLIYHLGDEKQVRWSKTLIFMMRCEQILFQKITKSESTDEYYCPVVCRFLKDYRAFHPISHVTYLKLRAVGILHWLLFCIPMLLVILTGTVCRKVSRSSMRPKQMRRQNEASRLAGIKCVSLT
jgi:hypothetical protein